MCCKYSTQLPLNMRMSSKYMTIKYFVNNHKILSINLMNVVKALFKLKGMTNHSKRPFLDLKAVFDTLVCSIDSWRYHEFKSILLKKLAPLS
jgi:hypothetical protein